MTSARSSRAARNRWLPEGRRGPMPWIIGIMMFLTVLSAACALGLGHALTRLRGDLAGGYTIQIVEANAAKRMQAVRGISAYLDSARGVRTYKVVPEAQMLAQLAPWLGEDARADELPIPALIDLSLRPAAGSARVTQIEQAVKRILPSARIDAHQGYLAPVEGLMRTLMWLAGGLVALMLLMTGAVVVLAANSAHAAHRGTIDIIHMLGATDLQLARLFQRRIALDAALGAMAGTVSAAALLWLLDSNLHVSQSELAGLIRLPWRSVAILFGLPLFAVLVAALTARITVMRALERNL
ncbi:MAG: cell division protein [Sphingobium sp.]|jgi:cell division transport system permease protein|nr:cell division protein [Sphingomonadaceae bacterium]MCH4151647.1 cell division protein [Sphingobium sp.]MCI1271068.1 cell division protein [Sphingobium sp.]MCI1755702.1 cell division protein [Sphingobium sp.]MCI2052600.1 cell division protein [Sphingobium sp.]